METNKTGAAVSQDGNGSLAQGVDAAGIRAHNATDKISDAARPTVDRLASGAHKVVDRVAGAATQAVDSLGEKADYVKESQGRVTEACATYMRANPVMSLGMAIAAGFLFGRLIGQK